MADLLELVLATKNKHKVDELRAILAAVAVAHDLSEYPDMPAVDETGATFVENAVLKAEAVALHTGLPALADDSGIAMDALGGAPGVYSARYAGPDATDAQNRAKLLKELLGVPESKRGARFVCAVALAIPGKPTWTAIGVHEGTVTCSERGGGGFGYDSIFFSPELGCTFAEAAPEVKNKVSHRARALEQLKEHLTRLTSA